MPASHRSNGPGSGARQVLLARQSSIRTGEAVDEADGRVRAVAEGFVPRGPAPAERHTVARFVLDAVARDDRNPPAHPERPRHAHGRVLDETDRRLEVRFEWFLCRPIPDDEAS